MASRLPMEQGLVKAGGGIHGDSSSPGMSNHETLQQIERGYRLPRPAACPAEAYVLMLACWKGSPEERPAFATLQVTLGTIHRRLHPTLT